MDKDQVLEYLGSEEGQGLITEQGYSKLTKESVSSFLEGTEEGKALQFSIGDKTHNNYVKKLEEKGGKMFDADGLKAFEMEISKKLNPALTPLELEVKELRKEREQDKRDKTISNNYKEALKLNETLGLPSELLDKLVVEDFESTKVEIEKFGGIFKNIIDTKVESIVKERMGSSYKPTGGTGEPNALMEEYKQALKSGNTMEALRIKRQMNI